MPVHWAPAGLPTHKNSLLVISHKSRMAPGRTKKKPPEKSTTDDSPTTGTATTTTSNKKTNDSPTTSAATATSNKKGSNLIAAKLPGVSNRICIKDSSDTKDDTEDNDVVVVDDVQKNRNVTNPGMLKRTREGALNLFD